jgi:hypothetical protein
VPLRDLLLRYHTDQINGKLHPQGQEAGSVPVQKEKLAST